MGKPHILVVPLPAQGHVLPLMELSLCLAKQGLRVTFVNTEFIHERLVNALMERDNLGDQFRLVSIPDGLTDADRIIPGKLSEAIWGIMGEKLEELIGMIKRAGDDVSCVLADRGVGSALEVAAKMGIRRAAFCSIAAIFTPLVFSIPKLINDGIIDNEGTPIKGQEIQFLPTTIPAINTKNFPWVRNGNLTMQKHLFKLIVRNNEAVKKADWLICNSAYDLEPAAFALAPEIIPVGPLLARNRLGNSAGSLWPEDSTCLKWLDQHPPCSVIYVAFGSMTIFNEKQFKELALGLELSNMPFLWVVRPNSIDSTIVAYPEGFQDRIAYRGKIVGWAPQQKVLSHPSVACFLSHCGWNSTIEGVSNGVSFLCWPYSVDQFLNERYISDVWKIGLGFNPDERGIITREEIKHKVEQLLGDKNFRIRASNLKESAMNCVREGGSSYNNLQRFIQWLKA
ncbi:hypothetical protein PVL29_002372 [Vitis rotundifolia]|uniref:UDP-glycosyltransferase 83A1 n=1 Tax=Vitis rotundifolia TaxID=103349 RepID=A0AA39AHX7_VITRO|nr:hypothetical protein PVL29_002372 [Vitis rotundifolia]